MAQGSLPGLEDLYREIVLDHYRNPRNEGELPSPPAVRVEGLNPLCGDEVTVTMEVEGDLITKVMVSGQGCAISRSSASMMSVAVSGKKIEQARLLIRSFKAMMSVGEAEAEPAAPDYASLGELAALAGLARFPARIKCATLSWNALSEALDQVEKRARS
jgi:nitrogen fixation NifU-like protein